MKSKKTIASLKLDTAMDELLLWGFEPVFVNAHMITFPYKGSTIQYFPYKEWASGRTIKDCRGLGNLIKQIV